MIDVRVTVSRGIELFSPLGIDSATLINRPMGRFAWTNHLYFQITQPVSSTITPLTIIILNNFIVCVIAMKIKIYIYNDSASVQELRKRRKLYIFTIEQKNNTGQ